MLTNEDMLMISDLLDVKLEAQMNITDEKLKQLRTDICGEMNKMRLELKTEIRTVRTD